MQPHPHAQWGRRRPRKLRERLLRLDGCSERVAGAGEHSCQPIPPGRENVPLMTIDGGVEESVVAVHSLSHPLGRRLPQRRRTLDIGEEEGNRP